MPEDESGYVTKEYLEQGTYKIEIAGTLYPATMHLAPLYDPSNEKIRS